MMMKMMMMMRLGLFDCLDYCHLYLEMADYWPLVEDLPSGVQRCVEHIWILHLLGQGLVLRNVCIARMLLIHSSSSILMFTSHIRMLDWYMCNMWYIDI